jgi:hypothetical protein
MTGEKYGDEFAFIPKFQDMLANAGRDRSTCPITICLYPEELDIFAPDLVGALARYEGPGVTRCIVGFNPRQAGSHSAGPGSLGGFYARVGHESRLQLARGEVRKHPPIWTILRLITTNHFISSSTALV